MTKQREWPWKTTIQSRSPRDKAHLNEADARRAVAVALGSKGLTEDVQVYVWGVDDTADCFELVYDLKKGEVPPWKR